MSEDEGFDRKTTFCPLPWNSINIRNNGDIRICCNANSYINLLDKTNYSFISSSTLNYISLPYKTFF